MEDSSVTYYGDLIGHSPGGSDYNLVLDAAIKEAIDSGDQKRAFAITNEFMKEVNKSGVVLYEQHYYFHRFYWQFYLSLQMREFRFMIYFGRGRRSVFTV